MAYLVFQTAHELLTYVQYNILYYLIVRKTSILAPSCRRTIYPKFCGIPRIFTSRNSEFHGIQQIIHMTQRNLKLIFILSFLSKWIYLLMAGEQAAPVVSIEPSYRQVSSGERVELDCSASGQPPPGLAWSRAGGVPLGPRVKTMFGHSEIFWAGKHTNNV